MTTAVTLNPASPQAPLPSPTAQMPPAGGAAPWRHAAIASAVVGALAVGALGATLWQQHAHAPATVSTAAPAMSPPAVGVLPNGANGTPAQAPGRSTAPSGSTHAVPAQPRVARAPAPAAPHHSATPLDTQPAKAAAPVCASCGVVESVTAVNQKGQGSGLGAVAGGVLGGVVGHQVGGGTGKDVATVLGAIGGGLAGNEIEKRQRGSVSYSVNVRMDDGSLRTLSQDQSAAVGQPVRIENGNLVPLQRPSSPARAMDGGMQQAVTRP